MGSGGSGEGLGKGGQPARLASRFLQRGVFSFFRRDTLFLPGVFSRERVVRRRLWDSARCNGR